MLASRPISIVRLAGVAIAAMQSLCLPSIGQTDASSPRPPVHPAGQHAAPAQAGASYGRIPLSFEANRGQSDPSVQFLSRGQGYSLFLRQGEAVLALRSAQAARPVPGSPADSRAIPNRQSSQSETSLVGMRLVGANPHAAVSEQDRQITKTNYFIGNDPTKWRTDIPNYGRIRYQGIYPGIDLVYYGNQRQLEHDFVVAPGADPAHIRLAVSGAKNLRIDSATGDLILTIAAGSSHSELRLLKPVTYQESNGQRTAISSSYKLLAGNSIGLSLGSYNHSQPLVIDPVLIYSTYLGGSGNSSGQGDQGNGIAVDSLGNAYIVGTTYSANFPITTGAFQTQNNSAPANASTVFVAELNPTGTALVYSTYLGGSGGDFGYAIALDSANNAYVTGATYSSDFPVTCGAFQTVDYETLYGATTTFVTALNASGNGLVYSTYLGGSGDAAQQGDVSQAIAVDASGDAFLTGYTWSSDFPVTDRAFQTTNNAVSVGDPTVFVTKLNPQGTALDYSTFLGGNRRDVGNAIAIDSAGDAFVAGSAGSLFFPTTTGAFQTWHGSTTSFITELNPAGEDLVFSTYLGGSSGDSARAIAIDGNGFIYVAGTTASSDFPLAGGVVNSFQYWGSTGFVTKLKQDGSRLEYSTFLGESDTVPTALAVGASGTAYVAGYAPNNTFQITPDAISIPSQNGASSGFVVKLNPGASAYNLGTLLGGSSNDKATALTLDGSGNVYVTGSADSTDFPTTTGTFQTNNNETAPKAGNAFVTKLALSGETSNYPQLSPGFDPDNLSATWQEVGLCQEGTCSIFTVEYTAGLEGASGGPTPTGSVLFGGPDPQTTFAVQLVNGSVDFQSSLIEVDGGIAPGNYTIGASYSGDGYYQPASAQTVMSVGVGGDSDSAGRKTHVTLKPVPRAAGPVGDLSKLGLTAVASGGVVTEAKFTPPPSVQSGSGPHSLAVRSESSTGCSLPALTVTVHPVIRAYGSPNPAFTSTITGLLNGDAVNITYETPSSQSSSAGSYPLGADVRGAALANYTLTVNNATVQVTPVPLILSAARYSSTYGQTPPPPTNYVLTGLVNGDSNWRGLGAPALSIAEPLSASTPAGVYPIQVSLGTITSTDYTVTTAGSTPAYLTVQKATLNVVPRDSYQLAGVSPSGFTYVLSGLVNGDSPGVVHGAPVLSTAATASSRVGAYPIDAALGTLTAANYSFVLSQGVLNVFVPFNVGSAKVGSAITQFINFQQGPASTVGGVLAVTGGAVKPEFSAAPYSNQTQHYGYLTFTPHAPGLWTGALQILDNGNPAQPLISIPIYGEGTGPQLVFEPGQLATVKPAGAAELENPQAAAVDENGSLYVADAASGKIVKVVGKTASVVAFKGLQLKSPAAVAIGGDGTLYVADTGNNRVVELTSVGTAQVVSTVGLTLAGPRGLLADGSGDLLIADTGHNRIVRVSAAGIALIVSTGSLKLSGPTGLAVDAASDLFIADTGNNRIVEVSAGGEASIVSTGNPASRSPTGIAVDAAGTRYITESTGNKLVEVSPGGVQSALLDTGLSDPRGIALDHSGILYISDAGNKRVLELQRDASPTLSFASAAEGAKSSSSPQIVTVRNIGTSGSAISAVSYPLDFPEDAAGKTKDCKAGSTVAHSSSCTLTIDFKPVNPMAKATSVALKESVKLTSNTLNASGTEQRVAVEGTELK